MNKAIKNLWYFLYVTFRTRKEKDKVFGLKNVRVKYFTFKKNDYKFDIINHNIVYINKVNHYLSSFYY